MGGLQLNGGKLGEVHMKQSGKQKTLSETCQSIAPQQEVPPRILPRQR